MGLLSSPRALIGIVLMVVGTLGIVPGALPGSAQTMTFALVPAAAALTLGTWLVGTSEGGRPV
ncbi:hypothetical protein ACH9L7_01075 [Haloferax sp. S1W]|uniref:hypothetical protein n=1 Tax=Haloferax sp. S1W TaxID=3377110 RepID=UPI0037C53612